ncbi:hypothetical protein [Ruminococcus sp.]|uniref:hypothetical protein n=1 Tax=Ruminococcus sp. TaxID=41978 RepID=UPI002C51557A|nr:hypothetical protein [Ruminococcus sp.]HNZ98456.1 hypothetical protein [Ruminococcus sp.]HOH85730.1 hypothetical protein [Ruminococcus sp.]
MLFIRIQESATEEWQFIQKGQKEYLLKINKKEGFDEANTISEIKALIGEDAVLSTEYVDEIPVLASGKRKSVICEWKKD